MEAVKKYQVISNREQVEVIVLENKFAINFDRGGSKYHKYLIGLFVGDEMYKGEPKIWRDTQQGRDDYQNANISFIINYLIPEEVEALISKYKEASRKIRQERVKLARACTVPSSTFLDSDCLYPPKLRFPKYHCWKATTDESMYNALIRYDVMHLLRELSNTDRSKARESMIKKFFLDHTFIYNSRTDAIISRLLEGYNKGTVISDPIIEEEVKEFKHYIRTKLNDERLSYKESLYIEFVLDDNFMPDRESETYLINKNKDFEDKEEVFFPNTPSWLVEIDDFDFSLKNDEDIDSDIKAAYKRVEDLKAKIRRGERIIKEQDARMYKQDRRISLGLGMGK